jgi:hypothetical protein
MRNADSSIVAYYINNEKKQDPGLEFTDDYDDHMDGLRALVMQNNPGIDSTEAMIRAILIMMTRGDNGLSRYKIDAITTRIMHSFEVG